MRRKLVSYGAVIVFFAYAIWMLGPYLRSTIVRDASVTTWSRAAVAPIAGRILGDLPAPSSIVAGDGRVATIRNDLLLQESRAVEDTRDRTILARSVIAETREYLEDLAELEDERIEAMSVHAELFIAQLVTEIEHIRSQIEVSDNRIAVLNRILERQKKLVSKGNTSQAALDEARLRLSEVRADRAGLDADLGLTLQRKTAATNGVYITATGEVPDWLRQGALEIRLEERRARHELHTAEIELDDALEDLEIETRTLSELGEAVVTAPPGSVVFNVAAVPDDTVRPGDRILEWIDCSVLLVDTPVSDAELPLIERGMSADVVLEGESATRKATVELTRGSSATLGREDLVALAKGRGDGVAQVLLSLDADPSEFASCPVGRAAYVDFPEIGLIDILRARLRL